MVQQCAFQAPNFLVTACEQNQVIIWQLDQFHIKQTIRDVGNDGKTT